MKKNSTLIIIFLWMGTLSFAQENILKKEFYFGSASFNLNKESENKSKIFFAELKELTVDSIAIYGFADSDGNSINNKKLTQKRVDNFAKLIDSAGLSVPQKLIAKGEEDPHYNNSSKEKYKNRRVEIWVYYSTEIIQELEQNTEATLPNELLNKELKKGATIDLPSVQFYGGTANFLSGAETELDKVVTLIKENENLKIEIGGHICCGNEMELSILRAKVVYDYLVQQGVRKEQLNYKGYNNTQPKYGNIMDVRNRRVELKILE